MKSCGVHRSRGNTYSEHGDAEADDGAADDIGGMVLVVRHT